jgi:hypothetical protein
MDYNTPFAFTVEELSEEVESLLRIDKLKDFVECIMEPVM